MLRTALATSILALAIVCCTPQALAGKTAFEGHPKFEPSWSVDFDDPVEWQRVTALGHLVVGTATGLHGIDSTTGAISWTHQQLASLDEESYEEIAGTPLISVSKGRSTDPKIVILDAGTGEIAFDSYRAGIVNLLDKFVLPRSGKLLVFGFLQGKPKTTMFLFDLATGKKDWTNEKLSEGAGKLASTLGALLQAATGESGVVARPFEVDEKAFLIGSGTEILKVDIRTGEFVWRADSPHEGGSGRFYMRPDHADTFYYGTRSTTDDDRTTTNVKTSYSAHELTTGDPLWKEPVTVKGGLNDIVFLDSGMVVSSATTSKGSIKLIDYASGESVWGKKGKGLKLDGGVVDYDLSDAGLVVTTGFDSAWTDKGTEYFLNILDLDKGEFRFKQSLKVRGRMLETDVLSKGVLFVTTSEANLLDPETGKAAQNGIRSKNTLATTSHGDQIYAFSKEEGALYGIDKSRSTMSRLSESKVTLKENKSRLALEYYDEGLALVGDQEIVAFDGDGNVKYHVHYPAPKRHALVRALYTANAVRAAMASVATGTTAVGLAGVAAEQEAGSLDRMITRGLAEGYGELSEGYGGLAGRYFKEANRRFKASAVAADHVFMMVQFNKKSYGLAKVSKKTGKIVEIIDMEKDREPSYQVDAIGNRIYYRQSPSRIVCYQS